ncbi:hypothetical protein IV102_04285 [bacterium]|nr:hypothetical protein [bacterium]
MQIRSHDPGVPKRTAKQSTSAADMIGLGSSASNIDIYLGGEEYHNIGERDAAKMLGYFTQAMQSQGFPWRLQEPTQEGLQGKLTGKKSLSDLDALRRLQKGEAILFQPMRNLQLDLSSDSLGAIAAAGSIGSGQEMTSMTRLATITKNTRVAPGSQGVELRHGEPVIVKNLSELKLLYQMYNPEEKSKSKDPVAKAAHQLSYFNQQAGDYGWRFYQKDNSNDLGRVAKAFYRNSLRGAAMGVAVGAMVGLPVGIITQSLRNGLLALGAGTAAFSLYSGVEGARTAAKGRPLNTVEALDTVLKGQPLEVQETQMRGIGVPVAGKISWFSDRGNASTITGAQELDTFFWMQNQAAKPEEEPAPPPPPSTVYIDNSQHHYHLPHLRG